MPTLINRGLSLLVYSAYLAAAYAHAGGEAMLKVTMGLLLPMVCIWFPEPLGEYSGTIRGQTMTSSTPAFLVCAGGWLILVGAPVIGYLLSKGI
jgi:hypothetical protein